MKKIGVIIAVVIMIIGSTGCRQSNYLKELDAMPVWSNDLSTSIPQTEVYQIVTDFMDAPSEKDKKVLVLGWDGGKAEALANVVNMGVETSGYNPDQYMSGVNQLLEHGGGAYLAFSGGDKKGKEKQDTSTAPGWASILTGKWVTEHGIKDNNGILDENVHTFLYKYAEQGYPSLFMARWDDHFTKTYTTEMDQIGDLPLEYVQHKSDKESRDYLVNAISTGERDVIFAILEDPDYNGHGTGFSNDNGKYVNSIKNTDMLSYEIIEAVYARPTYEEEEWLILMTTDHGGYKKRHGMQTAEERQTFIVSNRPLDEKYFSKGYNGYTMK